MLFVSTYKQAVEQIPNQINSAYFLRILYFWIVILHTRPHHFDKKESNDLCTSPALRSGYFQHKPGTKSMDLKSFLFFPFPGAFEILRKATMSFVMSVRLSAKNNSASTGRIFVKIDVWVVLSDLPRTFKFHQNRTRIVLYVKTNIHFWSYLSQFYLEWEIFRKNL